MASKLITLPFRPTINLRGGVEAGAKLFVYSTGTTTPVSVYSDSALVTPLTNPVVADAFGVFPDVYYNDTQIVRVVMQQANGTVLSDTDPYVSDAASAEASADAAATSAAAAEAIARPIYADNAAGLAATAEGDFFFVDQGDGTADLYRHDAGPTATAMGRTTIIDPQASGAAGLLGYTQGGTGAATRTVQAKLRETVSLKDFGAVGDGVTDDSAAYLVALAAAQAAGVALYAPAGDYNFNGATLSNGGLTPGLDLGSAHVWANGDATFRNIGTAHYSDSVKFHGLKFVDCVQPIYLTGSLDALEITKCTFVGNLRSINHNDTSAGVIVKNVLIERNVFEDATADSDFMTSIGLRRPEQISNVAIRLNTFKNINPTGTGSYIACEVGDAGKPVTNFSGFRFEDNLIFNCGNATATWNASITSYGCLFIGSDHVQERNYVFSNYWMQPIYGKGNGFRQINNVCRDNQFSGVSIKVYDTTLISKENIQDGNIVTGQCDKRPAIRMFGLGRSVNSIVDITTTAQVDTQGGLCFQQTISNSTDGKVLITGDFKSDNKGITISTGGDIEMDVRLESAGDGINITPASGKTIGRCDISGTIISVGAALQVNPVKYLTTSGGLDVRCNRSNGSIMTVNVSEGCDLTGTRLFLTDDAADGLANSRPVLLYAAEGGETANCNINLSDLTFVTERNMTSVFRHFAAAGLLAPNKVNITMDRVVVDLQGKSCTNFMDTLNNIKKVSLLGCEVDGTMTRTIDGSGRTIDKLLINQGLMDYVPTDDVAGHTNATATLSRIANNKTS